MYHDGKKADSDEVSMMQAYLRQQAARLNQPLDWFFDQPELRDDGEHPLLDDDNEPRYSRAVMRRAFATWAKLDNKNPFKFVCKYYHTLEKMGDENAPPHVQKYVKESLQVPPVCKEAPDQLLHQPRIDSPLHFSLLHRPALFRHFHSDNSYLRMYGEPEPTAFNADSYKYAPYDMHPCAKQFYEARKDGKSAEYEFYAGDIKVQDVMCKMTPVDSPSKASEDSCYQSMSSPITDHEEE